MKKVYEDTLRGIFTLEKMYHQMGQEKSMIINCAVYTMRQVESVSAVIARRIEMMDNYMELSHTGTLIMLSWLMDLAELAENYASIKFYQSKLKEL